MIHVWCSVTRQRDVQRACWLCVPTSCCSTWCVLNVCWLAVLTCMRTQTSLTFDLRCLDAAAPTRVLLDGNSASPLVLTSRGGRVCMPLHVAHRALLQLRPRDDTTTPPAYNWSAGGVDCRRFASMFDERGATRASLGVLQCVAAARGASLPLCVMYKVRHVRMSW
jgi:hypothetical protein